MSDLLVRPGRIESQGESIYYEWTTAGEDDARPVVVLTHGAGGTHAAWFQQVPALGAHYRVLTWDSRGFGNSTNVTNALGCEAAVADLSAVVEAVGVTGALHLIGQSMGGWWTVAFAVTHPQRVGSVTLSDTPGGIFTSSMESHWATWRQGGGLIRPDAMGRHPGVSATLAHRDVNLAFLYQQLGSFHEPPMAAVGNALGETRFPPAALTTLGVPLLVVAGTEDQIFPHDLLAELARELGANFASIEGSGHSPYFENAARYNEAIVGFLGGASATSQ